MRLRALRRPLRLVCAFWYQEHLVVTADGCTLCGTPKSLADLENSEWP